MFLTPICTLIKDLLYLPVQLYWTKTARIPLAQDIPQLILYKHDCNLNYQILSNFGAELYTWCRSDYQYCSLTLGSARFDYGGVFFLYFAAIGCCRTATFMGQSWFVFHIKFLTFVGNCLKRKLHFLIKFYVKTN